ncbi:MAG TPA: ABC transporter permease [Gemmatimonadaceae bacterium]|nr:ABC transporter permease [Gemmatimonadaceae bacterium]
MPDFSANQRNGGKRLRDVVDDILLDVRYAARGLLRRPGFTTTAPICLAVGIGANAAMFGVVDALLLRPPAGVHDPCSLVWVRLKVTGTDQTTSFSYPDFVDFEHASSASGLAAYAVGTNSFGRGVDALEVNTLIVTPSFMTVLGVAPLIGRFFTPADDRPDAAPVAVLGYAFWQNHFAGNTDVVGKTAWVGTKLYTVVGVAPPGFHGVERSRIDLYVPPMTFFVNRFGARVSPTNRHFYWASVLARLEPGVRRERLAAELDAIYHNADPGDKDRNGVSIVVAAPTAMVAMGPREAQDVRVSLWLYGVAAVVLLIACANVASLLLIRATGRRREIAVRLALGISRLRLARLLMTESVLLASLGCIAGLVLARVSGSIFRATLLSDVDGGSGFFDIRIVSVTLATTVFTGLICGLAPSLAATRPDLVGVLKSGERDGSRGRGRINSVLLVGQVALTLMLLVGAALFVRSLRNLDALDLGFDAPHLLRARIAAQTYTPADVDRYFREVLERVRVLPGVQRAALASGGPFAALSGTRVVIPGHALEPRLEANVDRVTPEFFETLGMPLLRGRNFAAADNLGADRVAIVNELMARRYWPSGDVLGKCIQVGSDTMPCTTIVGVVGTALRGYHDGVEAVENEQPMNTFYVPFDRSDPPRQAWLYVRSAGDAAGLVPIVRRTMQALAPDLPRADVTAFSTQLAQQFRPWRLGATMFGIFGGAALALAIIGLYGVLAFRVSQRTHEIGVRMALGAQRNDVRRLVVGQGFWLGALGVTIGVSAVLGSSQFLDPLLFRVSAKDPVTLAATCGVLLGVAVLASYIPARRAIRIDPMEALREL